MALPALVSGADCGPLNPLQSLSKQFDRDRGIQQDRFVPGLAGSSRETFRTPSSRSPALDEEAARFFSGQASSTPFTRHVASDAFDLSTLRGSLPQQSRPGPPPPAAWAADFLNHSAMQVLSHPHSESSQAYQPPGIDSAAMNHGQYNMPVNNPFMNGVFRPMQTPHQYHDVVTPELRQSRLETEFDTRQVDFPEEVVVQQQREVPSEPIDADDLSRTAGMLIEAVKEETNPKFQNSAFLGLMRQLRDKEMTIKGTDMVNTSESSTDGYSSSWAHDFTTTQPDVKGKGKARADVGTIGEGTLGAQTVEPNISQTVAAAARGSSLDHLASQQLNSTRKSVHFDPHEGRDSWLDDETLEDRFWRQENAEYQSYWNESLPPVISHETPDWDKLQSDWDRFEATATGIKPVSVYQFQPNNPYLVGDSSTNNHMMHTQGSHSNESVFEKEAFVQNNMRNPVGWFELGVKQQENERESMAIQALQRAVELDPSYLEAWLALAISHTNENEKSGAYDAIEHWVRNNERYKDRQPLRLMEEMSGPERHEQLLQCLMGLARAAPEVDADVQTALGVLLNTCEDYEKAQDCFGAALAVRPNDWLLYNRVGATLANRGRSDDALWYYYRALELNPSYIRARFNLGISCINMKRFDEAAIHILDALVLQENDGADGREKRGITSSTLWDCLRTTCLHLQRSELTSLCDSQDLEGFRKAFWP